LFGLSWAWWYTSVIPAIQEVDRRIESSRPNLDKVREILSEMQNTNKRAGDVAHKPTMSNALEGREGGRKGERKEGEKTLIGLFIEAVNPSG
jgi:hypothetical protein